MTISIIVIPSVIHQGNDTRVSNVTFIPFSEERRAQREHSRPPHSSAEELITNQQFYGTGAGGVGGEEGDVSFLLVSGRAMCYLGSRKQGWNNDGDGECNLILLFGPPLTPLSLYHQQSNGEVIRVQSRRRFQGGRQTAHTSHIHFHHHAISRLLCSLTATSFPFDNYSPLLANDSDKNKSPPHASPLCSHEDSFTGPHLFIKQLGKTLMT